MQQTERLETQTTNVDTTRTCAICAVAIPPRRYYCETCGHQHTKANAARARRALNMAPGERSVGRRYAENGLREIASKFQVTRQRVQQIERIALLKMRRALLPYLQEHDPVMANRMAKRETSEQQFVARTAVRRQLNSRQTQLIRQMKELAAAYHQDGQAETARAIMSEVRDLESRLAHVLRGRTVVT